jgi:hypothetical protein
MARLSLINAQYGLRGIEMLQARRGDIKTMRNEATDIENRADSGVQLERRARRPLAVGNIYRFKGYKSNGFKVVAMSLPGTPSDDGGLPGVSVKWLNKAVWNCWYPFNSEAEFWAHILFSNACDPEHA